MSEETKYPSDRAMKAAVIMEIHAATSTQTVAKGRALDELFPGYEDMLAALKAQEDADAANEERLGYEKWQRLEDAAKALRLAAIAKAEGRTP